MKRFTVLLLVLTLVVSSLFAGGSSAGTSRRSSGAAPISIFLEQNGRTWDPNLPNSQEIMRRTNTVLDIITSAEANALNLLFASGDLPDLISTGMSYQQYVSTGYLLPLNDLLRTHGQNLQRTISQDGWSLMSMDGKIYAVPRENNRIKLFTYVRADWLKNVGIDLSRNQDYGNFGGKVVTLNEFADILTKFTRNDPNRSGRNDTYGLGTSQQMNNWKWTNVYGAFGGIPGQYYIENNRAIPWVVTDQYRAALQYINSLWRGGVIDPEIYLNNNDQAKQKMINSSAGAATGEWWSLGYTLQIDGLQALVPEADIIPLRLTSNDGRLSGVPDNGLISGGYSISTMSKNQEKAMELMDFLSTDEGYYLTWYGIQGSDYNMVNGFPARTDLGNTRYNNMILDTLFPIGFPLTLHTSLLERPLSNWDELLRQKWEILANNNNQPNYTSAFYGIPDPAAFHEYGVDVNNWIEQSAMAFITGETPLNDTNWNAYLDTWRRMGGVRILQGFIDNYNSVKGTRVTAGIN